MSTFPVRTTVVGSYPFPGWLEFASQNLDKFGAADIEEMIEDAVITAIHDQVTAGLDVITDGEQTRLDFNLSFYGFIKAFRTMKQKPGSLDRLRMIKEEKIILLGN
jgi:5-methyltetrahydropteroyltriglutamate--homocysteine methyltransferase